MNAGKIAEYAVGILVPLGMFWGMERLGQRHFESCSWRLAESEAKQGGVAPASLPRLKIWHITPTPACVSKARTGAIGKAVRPPVYRIEIRVQRAGRKLRGAATVLGLLRSTLCLTFK